MILSFATKNYAHWLDLLLRTYKKTNPGRKAKIYLIMEKEDFDQYKSDEYFEYCWIPVKQSLNMTEEKGKVRSALRIKTSLILWEMILNPNQKFIWIDADSIVLKDIQPLLDKLDSFDLMATMRPWKPVDQQKLAAGVMGINPTQAMIKLFTKASKDVWGHWEGWWSEQLHIYNNLDESINIYSFEEEEHSLKNTRDAIIMSHHANKYDDLKQYCEEIERS